MCRAVERRLRRLADPQKAAVFRRFFKAGKGEYAEGDLFMGIAVPQLRAVAQECADLPLRDIATLLKDPYHEMRAVGLFILVRRYERGDAKTRKGIVAFYRAHLHCVNNWDLVDLSAYKILGDWLCTRDRGVLYRLAKKRHLWGQRVAMVSTYAFIRRGDLADTFAIAELFLDHEHDLIHKAVGWMLREAGKRDVQALLCFLRTNARRMPRTALRYAIERLPAAERRRWLRVTRDA